MLYYSHTNEDNRIEQELLQSSACETAIVIAGSGERVLALMNNPACKKLLAVDINKEAIFLLQLKLAAITCLTNEEYFQFAGHYTAPAKSRLDFFEKTRPHLAAECAAYWEQHLTAVKNGFFYAGHFEAFLDRVRPVIKLFLGNKFQRIFDYSYFNARLFPETRWKLICRIFSQKWVYKFWGNKDLAFIGPGSQTERIPAALTEIIKKGKASSCFMAYLIFKGHLREMPEKDLPPPLQGNVLNEIRSRIINREIMIEYCQDDLLNCIKQKRGEWAKPVFISASDILSFEDRNYLDELIKSALQETGDRIVFRSFLRNILTTQELKELAVKYGSILQHDEQESTGMYQVISITKVAGV